MPKMKNRSLRLNFKKYCYCFIPMLPLTKKKKLSNITFPSSLPPHLSLSLFFFIFLFCLCSIFMKFLPAFLFCLLFSSSLSLYILPPTPFFLSHYFHNLFFFVLIVFINFSSHNNNILLLFLFLFD